MHGDEGDDDNAGARESKRDRRARVAESLMDEVGSICPTLPHPRSTVTVMVGENQSPVRAKLSSDQQDKQHQWQESTTG